MHKRVSAVALSVVVVLGMNTRANEKPTEMYQQAMRDSAAALQSMRAAGKEIEDSGSGFQDYEPYAKATATMKASFATTLAFWQAQKKDDAVKQAQIAMKAVGEIEAAAKDRDYRELLESFTALNQTCAACHMAHRERLPDGSFEIK